MTLFDILESLGKKPGVSVEKKHRTVVLECQAA
jgi:hypothetical protein